MLRVLCLVLVGCGTAASSVAPASPPARGTAAEASAHAELEGDWVLTRHGAVRWRVEPRQGRVGLRRVGAETPTHVLRITERGERWAALTTAGDASPAVRARWIGFGDEAPGWFVMAMPDGRLVGYLSYPQREVPDELARRWFLHGLAEGQERDGSPRVEGFDDPRRRRGMRRLPPPPWRKVSGRALTFGASHWALENGDRHELHASRGFSPNQAALFAAIPGEPDRRWMGRWTRWGPLRFVRSQASEEDVMLATTKAERPAWMGAVPDTQEPGALEPATLEPVTPSGQWASRHGERLELRDGTGTLRGVGGERAVELRGAQDGVTWLRIGETPAVIPDGTDGPAVFLGEHARVLEPVGPVPQRWRGEWSIETAESARARLTLRASSFALHQVDGSVVRGDARAGNRLFLFGDARSWAVDLRELGPDALLASGLTAAPGAPTVAGDEAHVGGGHSEGALLYRGEAPAWSLSGNGLEREDARPGD